MVIAAFGMSGLVPLPWNPEHPLDVRPGAARPVWDDNPHRAARLHQGPVRSTGGRPTEPTEPAGRLLLTGWVAEDGLPAGPVNRGEPPTAALCRLLDDDPDGAVRALRGDFVLAHLSPDRRTLRLYRSVNALIPLFWRHEDDRLGWASDPRHLLAGGRPRRRDVDVDLLPMVIAERGFPRERSWFTHVRRLPAGERLTLHVGQCPTVARFDEFTPVGQAPPTVRAAADTLREHLGRACGRMLADQRASVVALSGGIDSAAVAYEMGRQPGQGAAVHYTLESFPSFAADRQAAQRVAAACGLTWVPYEMSKHTCPGGDYLRVPEGGGLPQTHVPTHGLPATIEQAESTGAMFVLFGLLADQVFAHDQNRGLLQVAGPGVLDPRVAGEPIWQLLRTAAESTFAGSGGGIGRYLLRLAAGDPTTALPSREMIVHPLGFTPEAGETVTAALRVAADRARDGVRRAASRLGGPRRALPQGITSLFLLAEAFNTPNLQAAWLNDCLPKQRFFTTPFADRDVIEYALTLPGRHRLGFGHGMTVDKFALRLAYGRAGAPGHAGLPGQVGHRMQQARIDAISAVFVNQNFAAVRDLLRPNSLLCELGVLSRKFVADLTPSRVHRNGEEIARLCVVERWLEGLS
ncbi:MAG: asparagine synthase-related protein [Pseudonocardiaceae bacterium]